MAAFVHGEVDLVKFAKASLAGDLAGAGVILFTTFANEGDRSELSTMILKVLEQVLDQFALSQSFLRPITIVKKLDA